MGQVELCTDASYMQRLFKKCRQPRFQTSSHADRWLQLRAHQIKDISLSGPSRSSMTNPCGGCRKGNVETDSLAAKRASEIFNKEAAEVQAWLQACRCSSLEGAGKIA